ncbi:hypothetical protein ACJW30_05G001200 [Castanea mollissima]
MRAYQKNEKSSKLLQTILITMCQQQTGSLYPWTRHSNTLYNQNSYSRKYKRRGHNQNSCYLTQNAIEYFIRKFFPPIINQDTLTRKISEEKIKHMLQQRHQL